ncbi:MAG: sulfotransferase [Steroidobacteraceae bacterium]
MEHPRQHVPVASSEPPYAQISVNASELMTRAREQAAITGIDDAPIEEPLQQFLNALNTEAELSDTGARALENILLLILCNRLRMQRDLRDHPEIDAEKIDRPVILSSGARTGSTKLHKLLAASGDFHYLPCWRGISLSLLSGDRGEHPAQRIAQADAWVRWFNEHAPEARYTHEFSTFEPEEENLLLAHDLFGQYMIAFTFVPSFAQWAMTESRVLRNMQFLKRALQYLQWQFPSAMPRRWVLKSPAYPGLEPALAHVFPDARFVVTHRDPVASLASSASLIDAFQRAFSNVERKVTIGQLLQEGQARAWQQIVVAREENPHLPFADIAYRQVVEAPEHAVECVYQHADMTLSNVARERICNWERSYGTTDWKTRRYTLEEYGLTPDQVRLRYAGYIERFQEFL